MRAWLESEWQRRGGGALVLLPFALLFAVLSALRRVLYGSGILGTWRARVPVIVVGNITAGGTGKTPLVIAIVEMLRDAGRSPGVLSRGYGRVPPTDHDPRGVVRVLPGIATPELFGDEPVLIARRTGVPVYVSPDRPAAARALLEAHPEVDVLVSDDGLQHYALGRDIEIAVIDAERRFGNGLPLPAGPLREPVARLAKVDCTVMNTGSRGMNAPIAELDGVRSPRQFAMGLGHEAFISFAGEERTPREFSMATRGSRIAAVAGIGNPERFFAHLDHLDVFAEPRAFADHHNFQAADLKLPGFDLVVMTEKDAVKCAAFADARMWFLRVEAILPPEFEAFLLERIATRGLN